MAAQGLAGSGRDEGVSTAISLWTLQRRQQWGLLHPFYSGENGGPGPEGTSVMRSYSSLSPPLHFEWLSGCPSSSYN